MTAEPSASIWEVTRLILESPELSPSDIAQEHGYTAAEVAELMPIFLDTARTDWSRLADDANGWAATGLDSGGRTPSCTCATSPAAAPSRWPPSTPRGAAPG